jgi:hypothetical protein
MEKRLDDITRKEWVAYRWIEIPPTMDDSDDDRIFRTAGRRTPDEAFAALEEWEVTAEARDCELDEKGIVQ